MIVLFDKHEISKISKINGSAVKLSVEMAGREPSAGRVRKACQQITPSVRMRKYSWHGSAFLLDNFDEIHRLY